MPRKYSYRRNYYKPKRKWNSNFIQDILVIDLPNVNPGPQVFEGLNWKTLCVNEADLSGVSRSVMKVKNFKLNFSTTHFVDQVSNLIGCMSLFLVYVPEALLVQEDILKNILNIF